MMWRGWWLSVGFFISILSAVEARSWHDVDWETGQLIGVSQMETVPVSFVFEVATESLWSHIGIIYIEPVTNTPYVLEAITPYARLTPLDQFLKRASKDAWGQPQFTLAEPKEALNQAQKFALSEVILRKALQKIPYNHSHRYQKGAKNCSELVFDVYNEIGIDLNDARKSKSGMSRWSHLLKEIFRSFPPSYYSESAIYISPASILRSTDVQIIRTDLPVVPLSISSIISHWIRSESAEKFENAFGLSVFDFLDHCEEVIKKLTPLKSSSF